MAKTKLSFERATSRFVHRYTMEHVPHWAHNPSPRGKYYAPQYRTDQEWYENSSFPGDSDWIDIGQDHCHSANQSWPLGQWLDAPYKRA